MEKNSVVKYVLYDSVRNIEYFRNLKAIDSSLYKAKKTKQGTVIEYFYNFTKYKDVRTADDLSDALNDDEYLLIELNEETEKLVDPAIIITANQKEKKEAKRKPQIGDKVYLVADNGVMPNVIFDNGESCVALKDYDSDLYAIKSVVVVTDHIEERNYQLSINPGGLSSLYYKIIDEDVLEQYDGEVVEATMVEPNRWALTPMKKYKK